MKFTAVRFQKIGPFLDTYLRFPAEAKLHIIHGPNEAGKTSALKQMLGFLFRFDQQSQDDFRFPYTEHAVLADVITLDGSSRSGIKRTRGRANQGLEGAHENDLIPPGMTKETFLKLFAISHASLREGAADLFAGTSDLRSLLFDAMTGMASAGQLRKRLAESREKLLATRSGLIADSIKQCTDAKTEIGRIEKERLQFADSYQRLHDLEKLIGTIETELKARERDKSTLERLSHGIRLRIQIRENDRLLEEYRVVPDLEPDFRTKWDQLERDHHEVKTTYQTLDEELTRTRTDLQATPTPRFPERFLQQVQSLSDRRTHVVAALQKRRACIDEQARQQELLQQQIRQWMPERAGQPIRDWLPSDSQRKELRSLATQYDQRVPMITLAAADLDKSRRRVKELEESISQLAPLQDCTKLQAVLDEMNELGINETRLLESALAVSQSLDNLLQESRSLAPPLSEISDLERLTIPSPELLEECAGQWNRVNRQLETATDELHEKQKKQRKLEATVKRLQCDAAAIVGGDDILDTRRHRDQAWHLIRNERTGQTVSKQSIDELLKEMGRDKSLDKTLDEALTRLIAEADRQADALVANADLASSLRLKQQESQELASEIADTEQRLQEHATTRLSQLDSCVQQWTTCHGPGAPPGSPSDLRGWFEKARKLKADLQNHRRFVQIDKQLRENTQRLLVQLAVLLGTDQTTCTLAEARVRAKTRLDAQIELAREHATQNEALRQVRIDCSTRQDQLGDHERQLTEICASWNRVIAPLEIAAVDDYSAFVDALERISLEHDRSIERQAELAELEQLRETFFSDLRSLCLESDRPTVTHEDTHWSDTVAELVKLAESDRDARQRRNRLEAELSRRSERFEELKLKLEQTTRAVARMLAIAGATTPAEVDDVIARADRKRNARFERAKAESSLLDDLGMSPGDYEAALAGRDRATLVSAITDLEQVITTQRQQLTEYRDEHTGLKVALNAMANSSDAAKARQKLEEGVATLNDRVAQWRDLRIAERCLEQAIERMKGEVGEKPFDRAGQFFRRMTNDRYTNLDVDWESGQVFFRVKRLDLGSPIDLQNEEARGLSEGTSDQLWMALRLAAIEARVDQMIAAKMHPMPIIIDDALLTFDDQRAVSAMQILAELGEKTQVIVF
ncbi:MAG: hypothetical protein RIS70_3205, partial [Planctomycetota bacterium]